MTVKWINEEAKRKRRLELLEELNQNLDKIFNEQEGGESEEKQKMQGKQGEEAD